MESVGGLLCIADTCSGAEDDDTGIFDAEFQGRIQISCDDYGKDTVTFMSQYSQAADFGHQKY